MTDATDSAGRFYELPRLRRLASARVDAQPQAFADALFDDVSSFRAGASQRDDETVVVVDRI